MAVDYYNGSAWYPDFGAFGYDADGGMIQRRVLWSNYVQPNGRDSAGRIYYTKLPGGSSVYAFYYHDHDDVRIEALKANAGNILSYRQYIDETFETDWVAGTHELHLFVGDRRVATSKRPGMGRGTPPTTSADDVLFYHPDQVGSNTVVTDGSGQLRQETFLTPFGEVHRILDQNQQVVSNPDDSETPYLFTDQERDPETDLHYFGVRYYDPWVGRFMSQDPDLISPDFGITFGRIGSDPQQLNAYSYVRNSPTVFTDPTGARPVGIDGGRERCLGGICFRAITSASVQVFIGVRTNPLLTLSALATVSGAWLYTALTGSETIFTVFATKNPEDEQQGEDGEANDGEAQNGGDNRTVEEVLKSKKDSIKKAPLPPGSPSWEEIEGLTMAEVTRNARNNVTGFKTIRKLLTSNKYNK